jgi:ABC-type sugar transport system substrate-binding protein
MSRKTHRIIRACCFGLAFVTLSCSLITGAQNTKAPEPTAAATESVATENGESIRPEQPTATMQPSENPSGQYGYEDMTVGFIQTGDEGSWRDANSASFRETAEELNITLKFYKAQSKLENQREAFRGFIADEQVNVIVLAAVDPSGWEGLLRDAKEAGKVVVLEDRRIDAPENLYDTYVGSDFVEEGRKAADAMCQLLAESSKKKVVELVGSVGASAARDRGQGFRETMSDCGIVIVESRPANWNSTEGQEVMRKILQKTTDIQGVFAQNDDMAIGAIKAIKEFGLHPGRGIKLVSVDGTRAAFQAMIDGDLNATVECNPWLGPQVYEAALKALNGETLPKWIPSEEEVFWAKDAADLIGTRRY